MDNYRLLISFLFSKVGIPIFVGIVSAILLIIKIKKNPNNKEKLKVELSKNGFFRLFTKSAFIKILLLIIVLIFLIGLFIYIYTTGRYQTVNIYTICLIVFILYIIFYISEYISSANRVFKNYIKKHNINCEFFDIRDMIGVASALDDNKELKKIVDAKILFKDYNCLFVKYRLADNDISRFQCCIEYDYDCSSLKIGEDEKQRITTDIQELHDIKQILSIKIDNNHVIITKETIFNNYNENTCKNDIDDVALFYNIINNKK